MRNVYILHGCCDREEFEDTSIPSGSNFHWIPWLQKQLIVKGYNCQTPEMPTPYKPSYTRWKKLFDIYPLDLETTLVAHSCGGGFFLRYLSEAPQKLKKLILVAPWIDPDHKLGDFLKFDLNPDFAHLIEEIHIFYSKDEAVEGVKETIELLRKTYPNIEYHEFESHGHFCLGEMGTEAFPELLKMVIK